MDERVAFVLAYLDPTVLLLPIDGAATPLSVMVAEAKRRDRKAAFLLEASVITAQGASDGTDQSRHLGA